MDFDWARAIERNSEALRGIVEELFAMLGLAGEATVGRIAPPLHRAVLRLLRPAESAMRRLIVIAARGLVVKPAPSRPKPAGAIGKGGSKGGSMPPSFRLFDPPRRLKPMRAMKVTRIEPRVRFIEYDPRICALFPTPNPVVEPPPPPDGLTSATRLHRRLQALKLALDNLPRQAKRLVRWQQRRQASPWPKSTSPLRPGHPPGYRRKPIHEVEEVLAECDFLADEAMKPDTS